MMSSPSSAPPSGAAPAGSQWLLWLGFVLVALNLRLIFGTLGPVLQRLELGPAATLVVTSLPLLLLGLCSIPGVRLRLWLGEERALLVGLVLLVAGCAVRAFGVSGLVAGTALGSAGIALMNVIMPALARKRFGGARMGLVMGIYALMLGAGAVIGASLALPLAAQLGQGSAAAFQSLGLWAVPAGLALLLWLPQLRQPRPAPVVASATPSPSLWGNRTAWAVTLFFGLQTLNLYVFLPWMPTLLLDRGASAGTAAGLFSASQLSLMVASFVVPLLASRGNDQRRYIVLTVLLCLAGTLGLLYAPLRSAWLWVLLLGFGQGAGPALSVFLFVARSGSVDTAARLSAMAQTIGYLIALPGTLLVGALYQRSGDWNLPILLLAAVLVLELWLALPAGRNVRI